MLASAGVRGVLQAGPHVCAAKRAALHEPWHCAPGERFCNNTACAISSCMTYTHQQEKRTVHILTMKQRFDRAAWSSA
jgi:hypothetical protein